MKSLFNLHQLDVETIKLHLNDLELRLFKLDLNQKKTNLVYGKSDVHSQLLKEVAHYINSIEVIPNTKYSFTINIEIK